MGRVSKKEEFHIPFIKQLVFVGLVTIFCMVSTRFFLLNYLMTTQNTPTFTIQKSQINSNR
jgi:hypothetical protein